MSLVRSYLNWRRVRKTMSELDRLSNRELADIGINRTDIERIVRQSL